jgi:hypothetical protein
MEQNPGSKSMSLDKALRAATYTLEATPHHVLVRNDNAGITIGAELKDGKAVLNPTLAAKIGQTLRTIFKEKALEAMQKATRKVVE